MNRDIKVVLLGESGVGKSSLCLRFVQNDFKVAYESTAGAAFMSKTIQCKGTYFKFQIWDTAGQEKYKSLTPLYYRGNNYANVDASVAIIIYDITNKLSFATLKTWVEELKEHGPKKIIQVLIGNKTDLIDQEEVQYDEAIQYSKQIGATLKLTSCKANEGITEVFQSIAEQLLLQDQEKQLAPPPPPKQEPKKLEQPIQKPATTSGGCC